MIVNGPAWGGPTVTGNPSGGWRLDPGSGQSAYDWQAEWCPGTDEYAGHWFNFRFVEPDGTTHRFDLDFYDVATACNFSPVGSGAVFASDGSGYYMDATNPDNPIVYSPSRVSRL